ncbi:MAG: hypothetical protein L0Y66_08310 [Myxococcaceae bacterium]|nr:hypothetical protein [Myxococcaceae bacterium]MCI0671248.1 hypothetical protein [Myxococcaceae bacterium]
MQQPRTIGIALLALSLWAACGEPTLTLSESSKTVTAGDAPVTFTATLSGAEGDVTWALSGPGSISATTGASTEYTPPEAVASATSATLTATSGSLSASVAITINPRIITVSGKVVNLGIVPLGSQVVRIAGHENEVTSGDGNFTITDVTTPYDVVVMDTNERQVTVFKGLSRADPTLMVPFGNLEGPKSATLTGILSGPAAFPEPPNHRTRVGVGSASTFRLDSRLANETTGAYSLTPSWDGPDNTTVSIYALQWQYDPVTNLPVDYKLSGSKVNVTVANEGSFIDQDFTMTTVSDTTLSGNVSVPAGYVNIYNNLHFSPGPGVYLDLATHDNPPANFSYTTPSLGGSMLLMAVAEKASAAQSVAWKRGLAPNATGVSVTVPTAPEIILPASSAPGVNTTTTFSWQPYAGGVHLALFSPDVAGQPSYAVVTSATSTTLPDVSGTGLELPPGAGYQWGVFGWSPFASVNQAAGSHGWYPIPFLFQGDGAYAVAEMRTFTTAP